MSKSRPDFARALVLLLAIGLVVPALPAGAAGPATAPVCRAAGGIVGGVLGSIGGLLGGLGLARPAAPACPAAAAGPAALAPQSILANLPAACWRAAHPIATLNLPQVYSLTAQACMATGAAGAGSAGPQVWSALYGACAQASLAPAVGTQGMVACFRAVGSARATHDAAMAAIQNIR